MSAYVVSDLHINTLASFAAKHNLNVSYLNGQTISAKVEPARIAGLLYTANVESVNQRYREDDASDSFSFAAVHNLPSAVAIIKACHCFEYQASEVENYESTIAAAIIRAIIDKATRILPGYDAEAWGID